MLIDQDHQVLPGRPPRPVPREHPTGDQGPAVQGLPLNESWQVVVKNIAVRRRLRANSEDFLRIGDKSSKVDKGEDIKKAGEVPARPDL